MDSGVGGEGSLVLVLDVSLSLSILFVRGWSCFTFEASFGREEARKRREVCL